VAVANLETSTPLFIESGHQEKLAFR